MTRFAIENELTTRQVQLYVHLSYKKLEREAQFHGAAYKNALVEVVNAVFGK